MDFSWSWTPTKLVQWITNYLKEKNLPPSHRLEAELIVSHALNIRRLDIYLNYDKPCSPEELSEIKALLKRRVKREPLAYILGYWEFWTLRLQIGPGVLIPRQDTETVIETTLNYLKNRNEVTPTIAILELGAGSGAIPLALCMERKGLSIVSVEKSDKAIAYARANIESYRKKIRSDDNDIKLVRGDLFHAIGKRKQFDLIISNPPYITSPSIDSLQPEVARWEPEEALDGGADGLAFYRYLKETAPSLLTENGFLIVEHGFEQAKSLRVLFSEEPRLEFVEQRKDLNGNDRVIVLKRK